MRPGVPEVLPLPSRVTAAPVRTACSGPAFAVGQLVWQAFAPPPAVPPSPVHPVTSIIIPSRIRLLGRPRTNGWLMRSLLSGTLRSGSLSKDGQHRMDGSGALRRMGKGQAIGLGNCPLSGYSYLPSSGGETGEHPSMDG